eukprot:scaffold87632_cov58-Phaeocystis_antarctica.AAC.1
MLPRGRHEAKGSKWGETRRLLDTCAMSKRGQMLVSTREPRVEALSQVGHLSPYKPRLRQMEERVVPARFFLGYNIALFFAAVRKSTDLADGLTRVFEESKGVLLSGRGANSP